MNDASPPPTAPASFPTRPSSASPSLTASAPEAVTRFQEVGGYLVIPASPALLKLRDDEGYRRALQEADIILADSGLLTTLWKRISGRALHRVSGIQYMEALLTNPAAREQGNWLWLVGSTEAQEKIAAWLQARGITAPKSSFRVLEQIPGSGEDHKLLLEIESIRPSQIVIATTGGVQEKLGRYLSEYLLYRPKIHCVGAAVSLLAGIEKAIPGWAERRAVGWLPRLFTQPHMIVPRLIIAGSLARMLYRHRSELPPLQTRWADV